MDRNPSISPSSSSSTKVDRKTMEKIRRDEMKTLFTKLNSLLPHQHASTPRERMALSDQIDAAAKYIKELQASIERLRETKRNLSGTDNNAKKRSNTASASGTAPMKPPEIEVNLKGNSAIEVVMITPDVNCQAMFSEAIRVLHDEGVEIVNAGFSVVDDTSVLHTIHGKIEETASKEGAIGRVTERLKRNSLLDPTGMSFPQGRTTNLKTLSGSLHTTLRLHFFLVRFGFQDDIGGIAIQRQHLRDSDGASAGG